MGKDQEKVRKLIASTIIENPGISQRNLAKKLNMPKTTIQNILTNLKNRGTIERKRGSGRKKGSVNKDIERKVKALFKRNPNTSVRDMAEKIGTSKSTVQRMKQRLGLKTFKVQKVPDRSEEKEAICKRRARKLYENFLTKFSCCVIDDETYCKADFRQLPGLEYYVSVFRGGVPRKFKVRRITKFPAKYMVWQAICTCGEKSKPFVSKGTINSEVYIKECLKARLLPFIKAHTMPVLFWPDLATSHYSKEALNFYAANSINFVPREANPPNCPELRPIEKYWGQVKRKLKKTKKQAANIKIFKKKNIWLQQK